VHLQVPNHDKFFKALMKAHLEKVESRKKSPKGLQTGFKNGATRPDKKH
jgi:hypothetical protein